VPGRSRLFASIDAACEHGARTQRDNDLGQTQLFGGDDHAPGAGGVTSLSAAVAWTEIEQLQHEKDALGLYWSGHPIDRYADALREFGAKTTGDLNLRKAVGEDEVSGASAPVAEPANGNGNGTGNGTGHRSVEEISIGGIISGLRPLKTRKGDRMCVITLDDAQGSVEVVVFPEAFKQYGHLAEEGQMVLVKGKLERDDESGRLLASEIAPIGFVTERLASSVAITLSTPQHGRDTFVQLWDVLMRHKGDRRVAIELRDADHHLRVKLDINAQIRVRPSERLVSEVEKICGSGSVSLR
jgi:DNA polymerase-3 subunit alpha